MKKKGFTLIEMLIVIIIIGILAATLIPRIGGARNRANDTARIADIRSISTALIQYQLDHPVYPAGNIAPAVNGQGIESAGQVEVTDNGQGASACSLNGVAELLDANYGLGGVLPTDPVSRYQYNYRLLDSRDDHFVICAKLSDGSTAGNAQVNLALTNSRKDPSPITDTAANAGVVCPKYNVTSQAPTSNETYSGILKQLGNTGNYFCYVG